MTICARVQPSTGLNVVADVPLVTPFSTAHATAPAQKESAATSVKPLTVLGAVPSARYPQDVSLLNEARENAEKLLDVLHDPADGKKPRT